MRSPRLAGAVARLANLVDLSLGTPTDGQSLVYQASTGLWIPGTPANVGGELAYAENITGTPQVIAAGGNADVTNLTGLSVPASTPAACWIEISIRAQMQAVTGTPNPTRLAASLILYETTSGSTLIEGWSCPIEDSAVATPGFVMRGKVRIGVTTGTRTFKANVIAPGTASNGYGISITNTSGARSWMAAFAR